MSSVIVTYIKCSNCGHEFKVGQVMDMEWSADAYNKKSDRIENVDLLNEKSNNHIYFVKESIDKIPCPKCKKKKIKNHF